MTASEELLFDVRGVVKLAVLRRPDCAILVGKRLPAVSNADDAQATRAEREVSTCDRVAVVRTTMDDFAHHAVDCVDVGASKDPANAAHCLTLQRNIASRSNAFMHGRTGQRRTYGECLIEQIFTN